MLNFDQSLLFELIDEKVNFSFIIGIPSENYSIVEKILKNVFYVISRTERIRRYLFKSFGPPVNEYKYTKNDNEEITVVNYFRDTWNIQLFYTHLPVVEIYNPNENNESYFLPMELIIVDEGQPNLQGFTTEQRIKATTKTVISPDENYKTIRRVIDEHRFNQDSYLEKFGLTIDVNEMLRLPARILPPPRIIYKSSHGDQANVIERVKIGKRWINNHFDKTCEICTWAVVLVSQLEPNHQQIHLTRNFIKRIPQVFIEIFSM